MRVNWIILIGLGLAATSAWAFSWGGKQVKATKFYDDPKAVDLCVAAAAGKSDRVQELVSKGASVNAVGREGMTPLLFVMANGLNKEGIVALLKAGADPNYIDPTNGMSPMLLSAKGNDLELLKLMLDHGGNPNLRNRDGDPATFLASLQHRWENVKLLLDSGADINDHISDDQTLVLLVADLDQWDQVPWLIEKGANFEAMDATGGTLANGIAASRLAETSPQYPWLQKVRKMLEDRGVTFPPPSPAENRAKRAREEKG